MHTDQRSSTLLAVEQSEAGKTADATYLIELLETLNITAATAELLTVRPHTGDNSIAD